MNDFNLHQQLFLHLALFTPHFVHWQLPSYSETALASTQDVCEAELHPVWQPLNQVRSLLSLT